MKISVIIPAYNCAKYIRQTLDCVRTQTFPQKDIEAIVYLDGCTDSTGDEVAAYATQWPDMNLRVIKADENHGLPNARNCAIAAARGEYMHFFDADDLINTDFYKSLYDAAHRCDADIAVASYLHERWPHDSIKYDVETVISMDQDKIDATCVDRFGYSWRYLVRRSFWNRNKFAFPTDMKFCEDVHIMTQAVFFSNRIVLVPHALYTYKFRANSMLTTRSTKKRRNMDYRRAQSDTKAFMLKYDICPSRPRVNL